MTVRYWREDAAPEEVRKSNATQDLCTSNNRRTSTAYTLRAPACAAHTARMPLPVPTSSTTCWATAAGVSGKTAQPPAPDVALPSLRL
jgi:hypothetical protein